MSPEATMVPATSILPFKSDVPATVNVPDVDKLPLEVVVPAIVTFAPLNVAAVVVPDLIIKLPLLLVKLP